MTTAATTTTKDINVVTVPMKTENDYSTGVTYTIAGVTNNSSTKIFAEIVLEVRSPVNVKSIQIKRLKHPRFYATKTAEQLGYIAFPITLMKQEENSYTQTFRSGILGYVNPNTSWYYLLKVTPHVNNDYHSSQCNFRGKMI